jgi:hypothetical protein
MYSNFTQTNKLTKGTAGQLKVHTIKYSENKMPMIAVIHQVLPPMQAFHHEQNLISDPSPPV